MHGTIDSVFRIEWRSLAELDAIADDWRDLAARAIEPNVFYEPAFALSAAPVFGRGVGAVLIRARSTPGRLLGFFPARIERRYGLGPKILTGWTHPFAPLGTPLVDAASAEPVVAAWIDHIARDKSLPDVALLPMLTTEGPFAAALDSVLARRGMAALDYGLHRRALLDPGADRANYVAQTLGAKHRKELPRRRRRLAEIGTVAHGAAVDEAGIAPLLASFLALEAAGWKGRGGTAAAQDPAVRRFMEAAVRRLAAEGKARIDVLCFNDRAIAAAIALRSGDTMFGWKTAYDEDYAKYSPGAQLMLDLTQAVLNDPRVARMDSCATEGHPMIDHLWRERRLIGDRMFAATPEARTPYAWARTLESLRRTAIGAVKAARDRWRGSRLLPQ